MNLNLQFPKLSEALYNSSSLEEAQEIYIGMLRKTGSIFDAQYASKLEQSRQMLKVSHLRQLEKDFTRYKDEIRKWSKKTGIHVSIQRRQKDFLGYHSKIRLFLCTDKNLSSIQDLIGFRIVLHTGLPETEDSIRFCYDALNETISFLVIKRHYMLLEAEPRVGEPLLASNAEKMGIIVPNESLTLKGFQSNVKDYVLNPKKNGYQSLHVLVSSPHGLVFEVQIRTTNMDVLAEHGTGKHTKYKIERYEGTDFDIDFSKIKMSGFHVLPDGDFYDRIGLQKSIDPFNYLH